MESDDMFVRCHKLSHVARGTGLELESRLPLTISSVEVPTKWESKQTE